MLTTIMRATGAVNYVTETQQSFLGSCFMFRHQNTFLTAAHCIPPENHQFLRLVFPVQGYITTVSRVERHPTADLAFLFSDEMAPEDFRPLQGPNRIHWYGHAVGAVGFPEDTAANEPKPTFRYFRGSIQRYFDHTSHMNYQYRAGELSFGAPAGLSGGPVVSLNDEASAVGVVAENFSSTTYLSSLEELEADGTKRKELTRNMIEYGVFVLLQDVNDWLTEIAPG